MIVINRPYIYPTQDRIRLECCVKDDLLQKDFKLWYEVEQEYGKYLCAESADAFLLALLPAAAKWEENIQIKANISPKLLYHVNTIHIPFLAKFFEKKRIEVAAESSQVHIFNGSAVATGCSLGVDSLSAIYRHIDPNCQPEYRLTHLNLFHSCQLGDGDLDKSAITLQEASERAMEFGDEIGLPFSWINSNVPMLCEEYQIGITQNFQYLTVSFPLALQKFYKRYYFASSYSAEGTHIDGSDTSHTEGIIIPPMSNENVDIVLADAFTKRVAKTDYIRKMELTPKYIDVCWAAFCANARNGRKYYVENKKFRNCGWCDKCLRTLFTFELLGCLSDYSEAFDLAQYKYHRKDFVIKVVANRKYNIFYDEIYQLMKEKKYKIPIVGELLRLINVKNSTLILWAWQRYQDIKRKLYKKRI